ncbi:MAG: 2'-5' RNA ligase family protein [Candidatus Hodarchaeota archaeon]
MVNWKEWQKVYRFGTIVIWPPDAVREMVNAQREIYDPVSQSYCESHITVTQPLRNSLTNNEWDDILDMLKIHKAFKITYGPLNSFLPYPCIWYEIRPQEKVLDIRRSLHDTGYFNLTLPHTEDFIPHMTITEGRSGPPVDSALLEILNNESEQGTFLCEALAYIVPNKDFRFEVIKTLPLGEGFVGRKFSGRIGI